MVNPYILENINQYAGGYTGGNLPFTYPPHTLYFFWVLDLFFVFHSIGIYYLFLFGLLTASAYLIVKMDQKPEYLFLVTLLLTGFMSTFWNFATGNKDILFLFLFAFVFWMLLKEKYWQSSILMGLTAAFSLITAPFVALYLVVKRPIQDRLAYISMSIGVVVVMFIGSYCINPTFLLSYIGTLQGSSSPIHDASGWNTPTPFSMFGNLISSVNPGNMIPVAIISLVYIGIVVFATWKYSVKNAGNTMKKYSLVMLGIFMVLPRIKPYDFIILIVPLYFLLKDFNYRGKSLAFAVISLLPIFVWVYPRVVFADDLPFMLASYAQTYSLILIFVLIIIHDHLSQPPHSKGFNKADGQLDSRLI